MTDSPTTFYLGCAVWSYRGWVGNFYPPQNSPKAFLRWYSERLNAVEGNTTFYAVPDVQTVTRWVTETPSTFQFCPKFPRSITHQGLLRPHLSEALAFVERMSLLGSRLGVLFLQLPPTYSPDLQEDLQGFLTQLAPQCPKLALEVRHPQWFDPLAETPLHPCLQTLQIARVILDTRPVYQSPDDPQRFSRNRKPSLPVHPLLTADFGLVRFISHPQAQYNEAYLKEWASWCHQVLTENKTLYFFVHCPQEDYSPQTARTFYQKLTQLHPALPPLPWDGFAPYPQQLSLF